MNLPKLDIRNIWAQIDMDIQKPDYSFEPGQTNVTIEQQPTVMVINRTPSRLTIDQTQCWADMDLKHVFRRVSEEAAEGMQQALSYISKVVGEGEQLGAIEGGGNTIRSLAMDNNFLPQHSFCYGNVPNNFSLRIDLTPGELNMDWQPGDTSVDVQSFPYHQNYERGKINYYVKQKNQLQINVVGENINIGY